MLIVYTREEYQEGVTSQNIYSCFINYVVFQIWDMRYKTLNKILYKDKNVNTLIFHILIHSVCMNKFDSVASVNVPASQ